MCSPGFSSVEFEKSLITSNYAAAFLTSDRSCLYSADLSL